MSIRVFKTPSFSEEYGCCLTSWKRLSNYTTHLSKVLHLYPDRLYKLLEFCEIDTPGSCPYTPDLTKLSAGLVTFLSVAGGVAFIVLMAGIVKNFRETWGSRREYFWELKDLGVLENRGGQKLDSEECGDRKFSSHILQDKQEGYVMCSYLNVDGWQ